MYTALLVILLALAAFLFFNGLRNQQRGKVTAGVLIAGFSILFFWFMDFWGEQLWFDAVGYGQRFWIFVGTQSAIFAAGIAIGLGIISLLTLSIRNENRTVQLLAIALGAFIGAMWGLANWETVLVFWNQVEAGMTEPIFGLDASFYLFTLPLLSSLHSLMLTFALIALVASFIAIYIKAPDGRWVEFIQYRYRMDSRVYNSLFASAGFLVLIMAVGKFLERYELLYSTYGVVAGPGWTDVNVHLPALTIVSIITAIIALALLLPPTRLRLIRVTNKWNSSGSIPAPPFTLGLLGVAILVLWFVALTLIPAAFQRLQVLPNEITFEKPYIQNNIALTRYGFGLHNVEIQDFPVTSNFTEQTVNNNEAIFSNIRLWDYRALDAVYKQFQEIRLYYEFQDVDVDRYRFGNDYRQVMISAREMEVNNLPAQSQTFVNQRFKYTHGFGVTLADVHRFTPEGLPNLLVKNLPPQSTYPELEVKEPRIYYGELTDTHVLVNTEEEEFDYPSGDENVYIRYQGNGGVQLNSFWRKFLYGWKFDGTRFLLSTYTTPESRIMFHRQIRDRAQRIAPFLHFDRDPYIVIANGKLYWMMDAYTTSQYFPYSEPYNSLESLEITEGSTRRSLNARTAGNLEGINYIRNSVKVVIDAYEGSVDYYIFDENDPLIRVWDKTFPGLFKNKSEMPDALINHIRYPLDLLLVQGLVYAKYHMDDPEIFYNQEDLWIRATEKYYNNVQPVEPYYIMWQAPETTQQEYILMMPFTPKNRQVLIGWIAGFCDPQNYGRFLAYRFPKQERVLGPQQVETKIDQDRFLSGQLSLWDQRGSNVIRGNVLAIPVGNTLLYVEPIYLQAETAAYPELRLVVIMHGDRLSYANTFDEALRGILGVSTPVASADTAASDEDEVSLPPAAAAPAALNTLIQRANQAFRDYLQFTGEKRFEEASRALQTLEETLQQLDAQNGSAETNKQ